MIEFIVLFLIIVFYVIPLNILLYNLCQKLSEYILISFPNPPFEFLLYISSDFLPPIIYVLIFAVLILLLYFLLSNVVSKSLFVFKNIDISEWSLIKYTKGQKSINVTSITLIILLLLLQIYFKVIDVRVVVFGLLCIVFIFRELKPKKNKKPSEEIKYNVENTNGKLLISDTGDYIDFTWSYLLDALNIKKPIEFHIRFKKGDDYLVKDKDTLVEVQKNIKAFSEDIKTACDLNGLDNFHKISAVYTLLSKFRYDCEVKNIDSAIQTPSETLEKQEGDGYALGVCAAAILRAMNMEVKELRIPLKDGGSKVALAVEGADELVGNYFTNENKQYFYCELKENNEFIVGEMP